MNDQLATPAAPDDSYPSLEDQGNSFRAIASRPENFARRELSLHGVLEQRVPASRTQVLKKLVSCVELAQWVVRMWSKIETNEAGVARVVVGLWFLASPGTLRRALPTDQVNGLFRISNRLR